MRLLFVFILFLSYSIAFSGSTSPQDRKIAWEAIQVNKFSENESNRFLSFKGAVYNSNHLPEYFERIKLPDGTAHVGAELSNAVYEELSSEEIELVSISNNEIKPNVAIAYDRKVPYALIRFIPIRKNPSSGKYEKLVSFKLQLSTSSNNTTANATAKSYSPDQKIYASNSVLATGKWFRIGLTRDGVYKLTYDFLKNAGLDVTTIDPRNIRIYGNGGGQLPFANAIYRKDDLAENAIEVTGESDGKLDSADYILFYGQGPNRWNYKPGFCPAFQHNKNLYSDTTYYFITADLGGGKRITPQSSLSSSTDNVTSFDDYAFTEDDATNLIKSGREWYGFNFDILTTFNVAYNFPNMDTSTPAVVKADLISRCSNNSTYLVTCGSASQTLTAPSVPVSLYYGDYAAAGSTCLSVNSPSSPLNVTTTKQTADAVGWMNYIEVNVRRILSMTGNQMQFRDSKSVGAGKVAQFNLSSFDNLQIWEVTDPTNVKLQSAANSGGVFQFTLASDSLREFIAFNGNSFYTPTAIGVVPNQDLHSLPQSDLVIVSHPLFFNEALALADHHRTNDNMSVVVVTPQQIYNEFSSGAQDVSAIRDFMKMFYDRSTGYTDLPKYLLLFGDGSYDNKFRLLNNSNFIPTYQSDNSHDPTGSYVSDDFYGLLDNNEGTWSETSTDLIDIGVGRLPAKSVKEARDMLNKIILYSSKAPATAGQGAACNNLENTSAYGDWRNMICFIGDDEDNNTHESQADQMATVVNTNYKNYNIDKVYFDATAQQATPGGNRYPDATDAINKRVSKGALIMNYTGHGGEIGLSHERVVEISTIENWENLYRLPLFVTATCEFSRFDNPALTSAGEIVLLNPKGGGIGLLTTVRLVYSSPNFTLNMNFYAHAFDTLPDGQKARIGDLFRLTKVASGPNVNNRNFTLLGDPALRLSYPKYNVVTDSINGKKLIAAVDTLKALSTFTVHGHLTDKYGDTLDSFNGVIYPTVYDKPVSITTLSNDGTTASPPFTFKLQKNILYKGKISVTNGLFSFTFVVPKDIAYQYGIGRISYYAENGVDDANGYCENFYIGGSSLTAATDAAGPEVRLYMNDTKFVLGGTTNENPLLYAIVKDTSGINTVGNGIGHDLVATLDGNNEKIAVLNDYYQSDLNSYKSGIIRYPYRNLSEGKHTLALKVWDIYNNSTMVNTEFVVAETAKLALKHVLNFPNPFTTKTSFYFEHNRCCEQLDVQIQIFTITGKVVKSINARVTTEGFRSDAIVWDGKDDFGDNIGRGVYVYRMKIRSDDGSIADKYEKLVILN
ncbi:MAG: type IX secretion system sortase PorU [Bacteroidetes bacterium]|nr:type IX secretion system sortase PorU [Bacteroidota bacterium]